jgi:hypothetical protein
MADEGPYGDHTGYYNEVERFPVFTVKKMTHRKDPIYHSTYTGRPPDEPAMLGVALNEVFIPLIQKQYPEIVDFYLPPEGCSYRMAIISINLAVVNFLPLPIVDGGQFLILAYEGIFQKPVPIPVLNAITLAGLALIGAMFLLITFNDIVRLIG